MLHQLTEPAESDEPASWLRERIVTFADSVLSVVPAGFERYARLFHPATRQPGEQAVTWSEVAAGNDRVAHRRMQWANITGDLRFISSRTQPGLWDHWPVTGSLPADLSALLVEVLTLHTDTPDRCWFAVWDGFGALPDELRQVRAFELPHRRYHLLGGSIGAILESAEPPPWQQSANIWWPDDHAWCVATEVDFMTTYLGVSSRCLAALEAVPGLEILPVESTDGITWTSDTINRIGN